MEGLFLQIVLAVHIARTVPLRERISTECVRAVAPWTSTPFSKGLSLMPVAVKRMSLPPARSRER